MVWHSVAPLIPPESGQLIARPIGIDRKGTCAKPAFRNTLGEGVVDPTRGSSTRRHVDEQDNTVDDVPYHHTLRFSWFYQLATNRSGLVIQLI